MDKPSAINCIKSDKGEVYVKKKSGYSIGREFLGNISTAAFLSNIVRKHLIKERENKEQIYGESMEESTHL